MSRRTGARAAALAAILACGPGAPDETTAAGDSTSTTGATSTTSTTSGDATTTTGLGTTAASTTGVLTTGDITTGDGSTADVDPSTSTTEPGVCVADPAAGVCTDACTLDECCLCSGKTLAIRAPTSCTIAAGIVTAFCPWSPEGLRLDGEWLMEGWSCDDPGVQWTQMPQDGDIVLVLCGDTCAAYLEGKFTELKIDMFCEAG
jgi:hypothetical protein